MKFQTKEMIFLCRERERVVSSHFKFRRLVLTGSVLVVALFVLSLSFPYSVKAQERKEYSAPRHSILASVSSFFKSLLFSSVKQRDDSQSSEVVPIKSQFSSSVIPAPRPSEASSEGGKAGIHAISNSSSSATYNLPPKTYNLAQDITRREVLDLIRQYDDNNKSLIYTTSTLIAGGNNLAINQSISELKNKINFLEQKESLVPRQLDHVYNSISRSFDDITSLDGVTMTNSSFSGTTGTFTGIFSGASGTFSSSLTVGSQLIVSGIATSTIAGDTSFDSGTLYIDSINNRVGIASSSPSETLSLNGAAYLSQISAPSVATDRLYNSSGDLYWNGNLIGSASVGNWTSASGNVYRSSGNVGIGTTSPNWKLSVSGIGSFDDNVRASYFTATSTTASTFPYASTTALTVSGSTYLTGLGQGWLHTAGGTNALTSSTSPTIAYLTATSTTATSTFAGGLSVGNILGLPNYNMSIASGPATSAVGTNLAISAGAADGGNRVGGDLTLKTGNGAGDSSSGVIRILPSYLPSIPTRALSSIYWNSVDGANSPHLTWTETLTPGINPGAQDNQIFQMGHNVAPGGGLINSSYSGTRDAWEGYYESSTPGVGLSERHISIVPLDVATKGEIRMLSFMGSANVNRDSVNPAAGFQANYVMFTSPTSAGVAYGDSLRISVGGAPNFAADLALNNAYSKIQRSGVSQGIPLLEQQNAAQNAQIKAMYWTAGTDEMHLNFNNAGGRNIVHIGELSQPSTLNIDGLSSVNGRALFTLRDKYGTDGDYQSFISQNATTLFIGAPQTPLANANDATIQAATHLSLTNTGNLGIGTTSPWRTLSVTGSMAVTALTAGAAGDYAVCINNTTKELTNAGATGCVVSSKRFKENISALDSGLDELMQLKPSQFTYIGQTGEHIGLIAEDVNVIDPRLVEYESDGVTPRTVRYLELSALLIKSIQELNLKVSDLMQASTTLNYEQSSSSGQASDGLFSWIVNKFASTFGINFGQDKVVVKNLCANKSDGSEVCIDGDQLQILLDKNVITQTSSSISSSSSSSTVETGSVSSSSSSSASSESSSPNQPSSSQAGSASSGQSSDDSEQAQPSLEVPPSSETTDGHGTAGQASSSSESSNNSQSSDSSDVILSSSSAGL